MRVKVEVKPEPVSVKLEDLPVHDIKFQVKSEPISVKLEDLPIKSEEVPVVQREHNEAEDRPDPKLAEMISRVQQRLLQGGSGKGPAADDAQREERAWGIKNEPRFEPDLLSVKAEPADTPMPPAPPPEPNRSFVHVAGYEGNGRVKQEPERDAECESACT